MSQQLYVKYAHATVAARPWVHAMGYFVLVNETDRLAYERQLHCHMADMTQRPRPLAEWYMPMRYWYNEISLATLLSSTACRDTRTNPSFGPQLGDMVEKADQWLTLPYVLDNGNAGIGMTFPIFSTGVSTASPLAERRRAFIGAMAASVDFKRLASSIIFDVLQDVNYTLEIYDVTDTAVTHVDASPSSTPSGPRLLYGVGDLPQGDPEEVSKVILPSNESMLQPWRYKVVHQINLTDPSRSFQAWCRFEGSDRAYSWMAVFLGVIIMVVAVLLAAIAVSVTRNTRRAREKTAVLERMKEQTQKKERNKSAFIANTSHELRTPIIGLKGMLEQLAEGPMEGEMQEDVRVAVEEAERVLALIGTVLDISKAEAGLLQLEQLEFDARAWLAEGLAKHETLAAAGGLQFTCHVDASVPEVLVGDYLRLRKVVDSIVDNAVKFTSSGGVCVRLQCLPPHTNIPAHLLSLGCSVVESTPCSSPPAAASTITASSTTAVVAPCSEEEGMLVAPSFWDQVARRGPVSAVVTRCCRQVGVLTAQGLTCYWRMPPVKEDAGGEAGQAEQGCSMGEDVGRAHGGDEAGANVMEAVEAGVAPRRGVVGGGRGGAWMDAVGRWWGRATMPGCLVPGDARGRLVLLLTCEDMGCGIAEEEQADVFHAFMQPHHKRHAHGGSGLSLHISKQLVALMGGSIGLLSTEGRGTTLHVALPMASAPSADECATRTGVCSGAAAAAASPFAACCARSPLNSHEQLAAGESGEGAGCTGIGGQARAAGVEAGGRTQQAAARGVGEVERRGLEVKWGSAKEALQEMMRGMAILVVDDNVINRRVAASTLGRYGADVTLAESGEAALLLLRPPHSFRLVLMDLHMPLMDGYETVTRLRGMEQDSDGAGRADCMQPTWVVAMSADVDSAVAARAAQVGMNGVMQKPLNEKQLLYVLRTL
ncbi:hypothetical protein CLOM_g24616 [Closterium sp. NIES-68]|nr:hypothetical protein CLOM_g24616 [Closterium sp. NIES-68]